MALYPCGEPGCTQCANQFGAAQTQAIERKRAVQAFYAERQPAPVKMTGHVRLVEAAE